MDSEERRFLKAAIRVQQRKDYGFIFEDDGIKTCVNISAHAQKPETIKSENVTLSYISRKDLLEKELIASQGAPYPMYYVTNKGWNYFSEKVESFIQAVFRSFLTPIAVSLITTLVTLYVQGIFK